MKKIILIGICFTAIVGYSRDSFKLREIDPLVLVISKSNLNVQYDSILQDRSESGLTMKTYLTLALDDNELKKYVNHVIAVRQENGISKKFTTTNSFYYNRGKLIKVEELAIVDDKQQIFDWYYSDNKPLYYTLKSDKAEVRANLLLTISEGILKQIQK